MDVQSRYTRQGPGNRLQLGLSLCALLLPVVGTGCFIGQTVPAACFPSIVNSAPRSALEPINFLHLRRDPPSAYLLGPDDVLGIYVEGVLGGTKVDNQGFRVPEPPPVHFPEDTSQPPAIGYPIPVREDGTVSLPLVPPIRVAGLTLPQAEHEIRRAYTVTRQILKPGQDRIILTLLKRRTYHVLVIREDATGAQVARGQARGELILGSGKRGMTYAVDLPAYENDVLHALSASGGLPGLDAKNQITVLRGGWNQQPVSEAYLTQLLEAPDGSVVYGPDSGPQQTDGSQVLRIPLRMYPGEMLNINEEDIILSDGDIVFIESRDAEVFYTGGLLQGGQFPIPRDYDLDVLGAIAMAGGSVAAAAGGSGTTGGLNRNTSSGVGSIFPPTQVTVVRTSGGQQMRIRLSLKRALRDPSQRILVEPNDLILLEYTPMELIFNIILNNVQVNYFLNDINSD